MTDGMERAVERLLDYAKTLDLTERPSADEYDITADIRVVCAAMPLVGVEREDVARVQEAFGRLFPQYKRNGFTGVDARDYETLKTALLLLPKLSEARADDLEAVADAIDAARYAHPDNPRERPCPFAEADRSDREYALRLARAAIAARSKHTGQPQEGALRAVCLKLRTALDALRPFPLVVEPVAAALIAEADAALSAAPASPSARWGENKEDLASREKSPSR